MDFPDLPHIWPALLLMPCVIGGLAGLLAGLLGVGGGIILVPGFYALLRAAGYPQADLMHIAVATSLATIVPTGLSSALAHRQREVVRPDILQSMGFAVVIGAFAGSLLAVRVEGDLLKTVFGAFLVGLSGFVALGDRLRHRSGPPPGRAAMALAGLGTGGISSLLGIGGATFTVPFLSFVGLPLREAIGTAAALGVLISIPACAGFIAGTGGATISVPFTLGYVFVPGLVLAAPASILMAPAGARLAHSLPVRALRFVFALFMVAVGLRMLAE
ncbi:MAG TPA: sulfite exporter TauE/SafE family protein [Alphaproteobacteria bacterium]|nr:sulfite exporter TauE/SafE family protein [Alphaproteobacteria bacterium]